MSYIHEHSCDCVKSELDIFSLPPTQTSIEASTIIEYNPIATLADSAPVEFLIPAGGDEYIDLSSITLHVKAKIIRGDNGADMDATSEVGPVNLTLQSMFSEIDITLKDTRLANNNGTNPYKAYLMTLLSYGQDAKDSQLACSMYYKDTSGSMDETNPVPNTATNRGLKTRRNLFAQGVVEMQGRIFCDMFMQEKLLPDGVPIKIRLNRSKDTFCLMSNQAARQYKISITECKITVRKVKLSPSLYIAHMKTLESGNAKFPIRRIVCKTFTIPRGSLNVTHENLFTGQLPARLVFGCVENEAFNGAYDKNPFNFQNFDVKEVKIMIDGQSQIVKPITLNFGNRLYMDGYLSLFAATGKLYKDEGLDVLLRDYAHGYALYAFDLSADMNEDCNFNLIREASVRIDITFGTATPSTLNIVCFSEFENIIEIDRNRNVILDY